MNMLDEQLNKLNTVLFEELDRVSNIKEKDENYEVIKERAELVFNLADRIVKTQELGLKNQIWQASKKYSYHNDMKQIGTIS